MFFWFARFVMWVGTHLMYRFKIEGLGNIPSNGSFIVCANHTNAMDAIVIAVSSRRRLYFMGKKELFKRKFFNFILRNLGAFPVDRGTADMKSFKHALDILKNGNGLLLFAQGKRMKEFNSSKNGTALFALKSDSPIVPVGITASYKLFSRVTVRVGAPIYMEEHRDKRIKTEMLDEIMAGVAAKIKGLMG